MVLPAVIALLLTGPSDPYNRSLTRVSPKHCVHWKEGSAIEFRVNAAGNPETPGDTEFDAIRASLKAWNDKMAGSASVSLTEGPRTQSRTVGWLSSASELKNNENIVVFRQKRCTDPGGAPPSDPCWLSDSDDDDCGNKHDCWDQQSLVVALTTTTFDPVTGEMRDADVEFNQPSFIFTTVDSPVCTPPSYAVTCVAWDIENTMTHELGHALGLDHTTAAGSTMNESAPVGETSKRTVDPGSAQFTTDAYPKGEPSTDCVFPSASGKLGDAAPKGCGCGAGGLTPLLLAALAHALRIKKASRLG